MNMAGFFKILLPWAALISLLPYALFIYCCGKGRRLAAALVYPPLFLLSYRLLGELLWTPVMWMWSSQGVLASLLGPFLTCHFILVVLAWMTRPVEPDGPSHGRLPVS